MANIRIKNVSIRTVNPKDNPSLAAIIRQVMTEYEAVGEGYSINDPEVDDIYSAYTQPRSAYFVVEKDGVVMGGGGIGPLNDAGPEVCELRKMYFLPGLRGYGAGYQLVLICLEAAKKMGYSTCYLETCERMTEANSLYRRMGFEKKCSPVGNTGHCGCDAYYTRELDL